MSQVGLEKRMSHVRTSILLKLGGPLQLVVVLVYIISNIYNFND